VQLSLNNNLTKLKFASIIHDVASKAYIKARLGMTALEVGTRY